MPWEERAREAAARAAARSPLSVAVSNEVGLGIVPESALGREFRDTQGRLNQSIPAIVPRVAFIAAGSDGETLRNTSWLADSGSEGLLSNGAEQILTVEGYPAAAAARWLMLFDALKTIKTVKTLETKTSHVRLQEA